MSQRASSKLSAVIIFLTSAAVCHGQGPGVSFPDTSPPRGVSPTGAYDFDQLETINKATGELMYKIPLTSMPLGRGGLTLPIYLTYNSAQYDYSYSLWYGTQPPNPAFLEKALGPDQFGGWNLAVGYELITEINPTAYLGGDSTTANTCTVASGVERTSLQMPDGSRHILKFTGFPQGFEDTASPGYFPWGYSGLAACPQFQNLGATVDMFTADGSYIHVRYTPATGPIAYLPDGTQVSLSVSSVGVETIQDRNENKITIVKSITASGGYQTTVTDDENRTVTILQPVEGISGSLGQLQFTMTQTGFGGSSLTWSFGPATGTSGAPFTFNYTCQDSQTIAGESVPTKFCPYTETGGGTDELQVPSNSPSAPLVYKFHRGVHNGLLDLVTLPSGATTAYTYTPNDYTTVNFPNNLLVSISSKTRTWTDQSDGGNTTITEPWSYGGVMGYGSFIKTNPDGGQEITYLGGTSSDLTWRVVSPNGDSVDTYYQFNRAYGDAGSKEPNPYVAAEVHNLAQSLSGITLYQYDKNGNQLNAATYDWSAYSSSYRASNGTLTSIPPASGTLLKQVQNTYEVMTAAKAGTGDIKENIADDTNGYWNLVSQTFVHLPATTSTTGSGPGSASQFAYDSLGNPQSAAYWDSTLSSSAPAAGKASNSNSRITSWTWDPTYRGNLVSEVDPNGNTTSYTYDGNHLYLQQKVEAYGTAYARTFTYKWDQNLGLITSKMDVDNGVTTSYSYDAIGRQTQMIEASNVSALARQTNTTYFDAARQVVVQRDQVSAGDSAGTGGLTTATNYDELYRVTLTQEMESPTPLVKNPLPTTNGIKVQTRYRYKGSNSYKLVSNPFRAATSVAASGEQTMGWTLATFDQNGRTISSQSFNGSGLPSAFSGSNGSTSGAVLTAYSSGPANATTVTDQALNARTSYTDGAGRLTAVAEAPGILTGYNTIYGYDALDDLTCVNQNVSTISGATCSSSASRARTFYYDSLKRLQSASNPESGTISYTYDANSNLQTKTDNRGVVITYTPDPLNRVQSKTYSNVTSPVAATSTVTYTYATVGNPSGPYSVGQLVSVANGTSTTSYGNFDALGRAQTSTQTTNGQTYAFGYNYNISELIAEAYPTGRTINISYDGANRESSVYGTTGTTTTNYVGNVAYAAHGAPTSYQYGQVSNGAGKMVRNNIYNPRLQLAGYSDTNNATGTQLVNATLNWLDGNNNDNGSLQGAGYVNGGTGTPASMTFNEAYLYDAANRLKSVTDSSPSGSSTITNWSRTFGYDVFGNMWVLTNSGVTEMGNTPTSNVFTAKNQISGSSYDAAGNQTAVNGNTQTYDAENRQAAVSFAGSTESYGYDGDGRRVSKAVSGTGGAATVYVYDAMGRLAAEYSTGAATSPCATCYLSTDHLGSTRLVVDQNGNFVARHDFLPFGEEVTVGRNGQWGAGNDTISQKFTAKERDTESGLDYFGARYYGSSLGRFISPDPSGLLAQHPEDPQSWNLYVYARNNPLIYLDPNGLDCIYATDNGKGVESIDHDSNSGECGQNGGTWLSGYVDEDWAHYNKTAKAFEAASEDDNGQVNFAQFQAGAQTNDAGNCLSGCGSYGFASTSAAFLTGQLVGNSRPTDGSDPLDGLLTFMTKRDQAVTDFWKGVAGPINGRDNWAGPGGMGPPAGTGDWRAAVHDYNFDSNGHISIGMYFNPTLSPATSRALIQSNAQLMKTGGFQGAKEKAFFGIVNAFQWYADTWK